jgi:hypothetical protein
MNLFCRRFRSGSNPSAIGGSTIADARDVLIFPRVIRKADLTNNEAEAAAIIQAVQLAEDG